MGTLTNFATTALVDHVFKTAYSQAATLYLALCTTTPTVASTGSTIVETDYTNYVRKSFTAASTFSAASSRTIAQSADIEFAQAGGVSSSDINSWAIVDASTAGNVLAFGSFDGAAWNVVSGNTPKVASGQIEISFGASTNGFTNIAVHKMLDLMFRNQAWSTPSASIYFGLATATPSDTSTLSTITECASANAYARIAVPASSFDSASAGVTTNNTAITFVTPTGSWGTVTSMFICNVASGTSGDLLAFDNTNIIDQEPGNGDTVQFAIGAFDVDLD